MKVRLKFPVELNVDRFVCVAEFLIILLWIWTWVVFFLLHSTEIYPQIWTYQFIGMNSLIIVCALLFPFIKRIEVKVVCFLIQLLLVLIIGLPEAKSLWLELFLQIILIIELFVFFPFSSSLILFGILNILFLLMQHPLIIWGRYVDAAPLLDQLNCILLQVLIFFLGQGGRKVDDQLRRSNGVIQRLDSAVYQLTSANVGFQNYARTSSEVSKIDERKRISRDIHDTVGYTLVNVMMMAEAATDHVRQEQKTLGKLIQSILEQSQTGLNETRRAVRALREIEQRETGLKMFIKLIHIFQEATGVKVKFEYSDLPNSFGEKRDKVIYRAIQEGLTNSFRHGKATFIEVYLWRSEIEIGVSIRDNGTGSGNSLKEGVGLSGMRERLDELDGTVKAHNIPSGFMVDVRIPYGAELSDDKNITC